MTDRRPLTMEEIDAGWTLEEASRADDEPYYLEYKLLFPSPAKPAPSARKGKPTKRFKKRRGKRAKGARSG